MGRDAPSFSGGWCKGPGGSSGPFPFLALPFPPFPCVGGSLCVHRVVVWQDLVLCVGAVLCVCRMCLLSRSIAFAEFDSANAFAEFDSANAFAEFDSANAFAEFDSANAFAECDSANAFAE